MMRKGRAKMDVETTKVCTKRGCNSLCVTKNYCRIHQDEHNAAVDEHKRQLVSAGLCRVGCGREITPGHKFYCRECADRLIAVQRGHGVTKDVYDRMLEDQLGACAICGTKDPGGSSSRTNRFHIDHDHVSGAARGLLCFQCNSGIGKFRDDTSLLIKAAAYLSTYKLAHMKKAV